MRNRTVKVNMSEMDKMIYNYLVIYITYNMCSPTIRNICKATGLSSTSSVYAHLNKLERLGVIERVYDNGDKGATRNIRLKGYKLVKCKEEEDIYNVEEINLVP